MIIITFFHKLNFRIIPVAMLIVTFVSCSKDNDCNECKECELDPVTAEYDKNCSSYIKYCGDELKLKEDTDIFVCK